jgi:Tfp pilus assembly protein FimV
MPQPTCNPTRPFLLQYCGGALALLIGLVGVSAANAATSKPSTPTAITAMDLSGLKSSHGYTPALGESLERIVAKTMPESPLSAAVLSQAFVLLNPQAFGSAKPQRTQSTATLKVPNHNQLLQLVLARNPADAALARATETAPTRAAIAAPRSAEKRENWVRYAGGPIKTPSSFDGSAADRSGWVQYLGAAFTRSWSGDANSRAEARSWVQYPSLGRATSAPTEVSADSTKWVQYPNLARAAAPAAQPESRPDTSGWVRYVANRLYPQQQFAQLFD